MLIFLLSLLHPKKKSKYLNKIQRKATKTISKVHICWTTTAQFKRLEILSSEQLISYSKGQCHKNGMVFYHMRCCVNWSYIFPILRQRSTLHQNDALEWLAGHAPYWNAALSVSIKSHALRHFKIFRPPSSHAVTIPLHPNIEPLNPHILYKLIVWRRLNTFFISF